MTRLRYQEHYPDENETVLFVAGGDENIEAIVSIDHPKDKPELTATLATEYGTPITLTLDTTNLSGNLTVGENKQTFSRNEFVGLMAQELRRLNGEQMTADGQNDMLHNYSSLMGIITATLVEADLIQIP